MSVRSPYAAPLVFLAGAASSVGPCVAPRFVAIAGLAAGKTRMQTFELVAGFVGGLTAVYAAFGAVSSLLGRAAALSSYTYVVVAAALAVGGCVTLFREQPRCGHDHARSACAGAGGAFLLGGSFALVISPCCTPLVLGILAYTSASGSAMYASALLACFALGHALPVFAVACGVSGSARVLRLHAFRQAAAVVSATLMLSLAGYYAVLA